MRGAVTELRAAPHLLGNRVELTWRNPPSNAFGPGRRLAGLRIVRRERTYPLDENDGTVVYPRPGGGSPVGPVISAFSDAGLKPLTTYYYSIFAAYSDDPPPLLPPLEYVGERTAGFAAKSYRSGERLYRLLPAAYQRLDSPLSAAEVARLRIVNPDAALALDALPPAIREQGQLRRFLAAAASPIDVMRSLADALPQLRDLDLARADYLPALAEWMGWEPDRTVPVFAQRNEIRFAPHRYRTVGSIPNVRSLVTRYARWYTQVAEFADQIARSNVVPQLNAFWIVEDVVAGGWRGADDAAATLGFSGANSVAVGMIGLPATLTGTAGFLLRAGMEIAITADDRVPAIVRFGADDFPQGNPALATAADVAAVLNRTLTEVTASVSGGAVTLTSNTVGPASALRVEQYEASLVSLDGAPRGRLVPVAGTFNPGAGERVRLFYETSDPLAPATALVAAQAFTGPPFPRRALPGERIEPAKPATSHILASVPQARVSFKTFRAGSWSTSIPLLDPDAPPHGEPAAVYDTTGDRLWVAWVENPGTPASGLRFRVGTPTLARRARLIGQRVGPFAVRAGTRLVVRGRNPRLSGMEFRVTDFAAPAIDGVQIATTAEILLALGRLAQVQASVLPSGALALDSSAIGGDEWMSVDLPHSTAAEALGFDIDVTARGDWGDAVQWGPTANVPTAAAGPYMEPSAVFVPGAGGAPDAVWLFWARHDGEQWLVEGARATAAGAAWTWSPVETVARGAGGDREPCAVSSSTGSVWVVWARRDVTTRLADDDCWTDWARERTAIGWGVEARITELAAGQLASDREPGVLALNNALRVFFRSSRGGGANVYQVSVPLPLPAVLPLPTPVTAGPTSDRWPAPMPAAAGPMRLLLRSDRSVSHARVATTEPPRVDDRVTTPRSAPPRTPPPRRSFVLADTGTARRYAGTTSVDLRDPARTSRRAEWDDLLSYTVERPDRAQQPERSLSGRPGDPDFKLPDDIWYTRGTIGLFLSSFAPADPLSDELRERLRPVLDRFLPINERAVVRIRPRLFTEFVYPPGKDIVETTTFTVASPVVETYPGPAEDAVLPLPWALLHAVSLAGDDPIPLDVAADPADPETLRRRTFLLPEPEGLMPKTEFPGTELHGMYRDVVTDGGGVVISDSGWKKNLILNGFRTLLASFAHGKSAAVPLSDALGIQEVRFGIGLPAWDLALPPADPTRTVLTDAAPFSVPRLLPPIPPGTPNADFKVTFIQGAVVAATETNVVEITATLPPGVPPWPDGGHPTSTLREFGLVGKLDGADVLLNHVAHAAIPKDPTTTLTRTIRLVF